MPFPVPGGEGQHAMDQVPPGRDQFVVGTAYELSPREIRITSLGQYGGNVEAHRIGVVVREEVREPDGPPPTLTELRFLKGHEVIGWDIVRQVQALARIVFVNAAHAEQLRRPDHRVKRDVVLAKEVIDAGGGIVPPRLPRLWLPAVMRPFDRCRQIANDILEPDVEALCVPTRQWHGNAPVEIPRHRAPLQATADVIAGEVEDARPPMMRMLIQVA